MNWDWVGPILTVTVILAAGWVTLRTSANRAATKAKDDTLEIVTRHRDELISVTERLQQQVDRLTRDGVEKDRRIELLTSMVTKTSEIENLAVQLSGFHTDHMNALQDIKGLIGGRRDGEPSQT